MINIKRVVFLLTLLLVLFTTACSPIPQPTKVVEAVPTTQNEASKPQDGTKEIILATTTSTRDSGLLDEIVPMFEKQSGYSVKVIAVGTGEALKMGTEGNADVLLVHAPKSEKDFMDKGFGKERLLVMHNDFIIVGPAEDPAKIKGTKTANEAFQKISDSQAAFVSRGDDSGTHKKELEIWKAINITPGKEQAWYIQSGQGMADTLKIASEKKVYTLTDRATYLAQKANIQLEILVEGDKGLFNIYHVIIVNPEKWPLINQEGGKAFADFMVAADTQKFIEQFGKEKFGQSLFIPDAGKPEN